MVKYPAVVGDEITISFDGDFYIFRDPDSLRVDWPKTYRAQTAKSLFTRKFDYYLEKDRKRILYFPSIYKLIDKEWVCIFSPKSQAADQYIGGHLTQRELRDSIDW